MLKVSVKGSQDGSWGLSQSYLTKGLADYHAAADTWCARHTPRTILCFIQYKDVAVESMSRVYLATPAEVRERLRSAAKGRGDTILHERHTWAANAHGAGTTEEVPAPWLFSRARVKELLAIA